MYCAHISADLSRKQTCSMHSEATASLAESILTPLGLGSCGKLVGFLHDCGKFSDEFNTYLHKASQGEPVKKGSVIHSFAGVRYLLDNFHSKNNTSNLFDITAEILAASIGSHHGFMDIWDENHRNGFYHRMEHQPEYDNRAIDIFFSECISKKEIETLFLSAQQEISTFIQEKISTCHCNAKELHFYFGLLVRLITSALVDADRTDTRCFMQNVPISAPVVPDWTAAADKINHDIASFPCETPIQEARHIFSNLCADSAERPSGLYRLDLPTGGGKTLSALRFALHHAEKHKMRRVIYVAPLLSIIEQNAKVISNAVGNTIPVLEHHSNILQDSSSPEKTTNAELMQEKWDAPLIITTFVQLLKTLFSGKMSAVRRFHCLSESTMIIDEVQSLPPKMLSMFNCAINFLVKCCGVTVVLCSATQPAFGKAEHKMLSPECLISETVYKQYAPLFRRTAIADAGMFSLPEVADYAVDALKTARSLLLVCNTKREAADLYRQLTEKTNIPVYHLSAGMCMAHRKKTLDELTNALERQEQLICVSTQVIEAGIDISFDSVLRLSAGLDSIVQAAGRCNRHGESPTPQPVYIFRLKDEKLGSLREIRQAQNALNELLAEYRRSPARYDHDLTSDAAVQDYYAFLYHEMPQGAQDYPVKESDTSLFELLSTNVQFIADAGTDFFLNQAFRTAGALFSVFDEDNKSVLVPFEEGKSIIDRLENNCSKYDTLYISSLLKQAKPYTVSVPANQIERMLKSGSVYTLLDGSLYVLNPEFYDNIIGIKEGNNLCSTLIL